MKRTFPFAVFVAGAVVISGCASPHGEIALDPIGPPPSRTIMPGTTGELRVFSAFEANAAFGSNPYRLHHTDYKILAHDGKLLQSVHNDAGELRASPTFVELPVGDYRVVARANGYGSVTVPVVIRPGRLTTVHLEGSPSWPEHAVLAESNPVRLPHGEIAGWRASASQMPQP